MELLEIIKKNFGTNILGIEIVTPRRIYIDIKPEYLKKATDFLFNQIKCRFSIATGIDEKEHMEILYHFSFDKDGVFFSLKVRLDRKKPVIDTIADIIIGAKWIEREMHELLGIEFTGNEDMRSLLLSPDYKGRKHPLKKDV
jgi:Ni,Fe-hydrogenase III component G